MNTIILVLVVLVAVAGVTYFLMKTGKIKDVDGNNIPDALEDKVEEVKEVVKKTAAKAKKVAAVAEKVVKEVKVKTPTTKKPAKKTTK
jgi:flagellar basal body-associated protein FliL